MKEYKKLKDIIENGIVLGGSDIDKDLVYIKQWANQDQVFKYLPNLLNSVLESKLQRDEQARYYQDCWVGSRTFQCKKGVSRDDEILMNCYIDRFVAGLLSKQNIDNIKELMAKIDVKEIIGCHISFREYMYKVHNTRFKNDTIEFNDEMNTGYPEQECDKE